MKAHFNITLSKSSNADCQPVLAATKLSILSADRDERVMEQVEELLESDLIDSLEEGETSFEVTADPNAFSLIEIDEVDVRDTFVNMLRSCIECYHNLQVIHWGARTRKFRDIHSYVEEIIDTIQYQQDMLAEWSVEYYNNLPSPLALQYNAIDPGAVMDFESAMLITQKQLTYYLSELEVGYINVEHDVQSELDTWIRYIKKQINYIIPKSLEQ